MPDQTHDKATARSRFVNDRSTLGDYLRCEASSRIYAFLAEAPEIMSARTICGYWSMGTEPRTHAVLRRFADQGIKVLLPVLLSDGDLDWAEYAPSTFRTDVAPGSASGSVPGSAPKRDPAREPGFTAGRFGLQEPAGPRLGPDAIRAADVVLVPALAVSADGHRLGRGGGSYDRALARLDDLPPGAARPWVCALVYDGEFDAVFPVEGHDRPVAAACAPSRLIRFKLPGAG